MDIRRWVFEPGILYGLELDDELAQVSPRPKAKFREIGPEQADALATSMGVADARIISERLASGRRCFAAWTDDRIVAYGWVSQTDECIGEQEREIRLEPYEAYVWDCATIAECRGQGLYSALLTYITNALRREHIRRVWIGSSQKNVASLKAFARAGFHPVLTLVYARLFSLYCLAALGHPSAPGTLVTAARRALMTHQERAQGSLIIGWSTPATLSPCVELEPNPRSI